MQICKVKILKKAKIVAKIAVLAVKICIVEINVVPLQPLLNECSAFVSNPPHGAIV